MCRESVNKGSSQVRREEFESCTAPSFCHTDINKNAVHFCDFATSRFAEAQGCVQMQSQILKQGISWYFSFLRSDNHCAIGVELSLPGRAGAKEDGIGEGRACRCSACSLQQQIGFEMSVLQGEWLTFAGNNKQKAPQTLDLFSCGSPRGWRARQIRGRV